MGSQPLGFVLVGLLLVAFGLLASAGGLSWLGRLPGYIRIEGADGRVQAFIPLASMLVASPDADGRDRTVAVDVLRAAASRPPRAFPLERSGSGRAEAFAQRMMTV